MSHEEKKEENLIRFHKRSNITVNALNKIFKLGAENSNKNETHVKTVLNNKTPYLILLVGSPGVGKTTTIKKFIEDQNENSEDNFSFVKQKLGIPEEEIKDVTQYNQFFHISLDFIVERVPEYRSKTFTVYKQLEAERNAGKLTNIMFNTKLSAPTISSSVTENFKSIKNSKHSNFKSGKNIKYIPLRDEIDVGLRHAIKNRYNIIYDTTFDGTYKRLSDRIIPLIKEYEKDQDIKQYKVIVILVEAPVETVLNNNGKPKKISPEEVIIKRLQKRHSNMVKKEYIRAINPSKIKDFIEENKKGFDRAKEFYKDDPNIVFLDIENKTNNTSNYNQSRKNNSNVNKIITRLSTMTLNNSTKKKKNNKNKNNNK